MIIPKESIVKLKIKGKDRIRRKMGLKNIGSKITNLKQNWADHKAKKGWELDAYFRNLAIQSGYRFHI